MYTSVMLHDQSDKFLGLDATSWAAVAAVASFLATFSVMLTSVLIHRATGPRPRVTVQIGALSGNSLYRRSTRAKEPSDWPEDAIEGVVVRVENRGRTQFTASAPMYEYLDPWWSLRRWWLVVRRWNRTVIAMPLPISGLSTEDRVQVAPLADVEFFMDLSPVFDGSSLESDTAGTWHHIRVRVRIAGRRDRVVRRSTIAASPAKQQLSGEPLSPRLFLVRYFLLESYASIRSARNPARRPFPEFFVAAAAATLIADRLAGDERLTYGSIADILRPLQSWPSDAECRLMALKVGSALAHAGFVTRDELDPKSTRFRSPSEDTPPTE